MNKQTKNEWKMTLIIIKASERSREQHAFKSMFQIIKRSENKNKEEEEEEAEDA